MSGIGPHEDHYGAARGHGHAPETANVRGLFIIAFGLMTLLALVFFVAYWFLGFFQEIRPGVPPYSAAVNVKPTYPAGAWVDPPKDLQTLRRQERDRLDSYEWIDRGQGLIRIKIERAMELLPAREAGRSEWAFPASGPATQSVASRPGPLTTRSLGPTSRPAGPVEALPANPTRAPASQGGGS